MPTRAGIPLGDTAQAPYYVGDYHPFNWVDVGGLQVQGVQQSSAMRGQPPALAWWQKRIIPNKQTPPQGTPVYLTSRPYSRGAGAHAPKFGVLPISPIGAGVAYPYKLPVIAGPGARYTAAAIWFDVQSIPTSLNINPTVPIETLNALLASSYVGGSYLTTG